MNFDVITTGMEYASPKDGWLGIAIFFFLCWVVTIVLLELRIREIKKLKKKIKRYGN
jgi:hypothetical protein